MRVLLFSSLFLFSSFGTTTEASDSLSASMRYVKGSWAPEQEVPSSFYDVPGDHKPASVQEGQAIDSGLSVDDVFAGNDQLFTEESFAPKAAAVAVQKTDN